MLPPLHDHAEPYYTTLLPLPVIMASHTANMAVLSQGPHIKQLITSTTDDVIATGMAVCLREMEVELLSNSFPSADYRGFLSEVRLGPTKLCLVSGQQNRTK